MIRLIRAEFVKLSTTRLFLWLGLLIVALSGFVTTITILSTDELSLATLNQQRSIAQFAAVGAITRHLAVHQVLEVIVSSARRLVGADYAAIGIPDDEGGFAEFITDGIGEEQRLEIGPLPRQHGMLAAILADFEQREDHLTGVEIADTALMFERIAAQRGMEVRPDSPLVPR